MEGVLAHEVAHVANGDMVTMALIQGVVNAFVIFFARVIANVVRNMVDERYAQIVGFVVTIALDIVLGIFGSMIVAWSCWLESSFGYMPTRAAADLQLALSKEGAGTRAFLLTGNPAYAQECRSGYS